VLTTNLHACVHPAVCSIAGGLLPGMMDGPTSSASVLGPGEASVLPPASVAMQQNQFDSEKVPQMLISHRASPTSVSPAPLTPLPPLSLSMVPTPVRVRPIRGNARWETCRCSCGGISSDVAFSSYLLWVHRRMTCKTILSY
jgi:hypothetical protein